VEDESKEEVRPFKRSKLRELGPLIIKIRPISSHVTNPAVTLDIKDGFRNIRIESLLGVILVAYIPRASINNPVDFLNMVDGEAKIIKPEPSLKVTIDAYNPIIISDNALSQLY
jgi:hypothetical protein